MWSQKAGVFLGVLFCTWSGLPAARAADAAEKAPASPWSFTLRAEGEIRYDDNILSLSEREKSRFESDPAFRNSDRFKIDSVDDFILAPDVGLTFRRSPKGGRETSFGGSLRGYEYLQNSVKSYLSFGVWFRQELNTSREHGTAISGGFTRTPDYYLRELIDDDESLAAGTTIRNSLDYILNQGFLELSQELVSRVLDFSVRYALERRNYNDHFNERDSNSTLTVASFDVFPLKRNLFRIRPYYAHESRTSRGDIPASPVVDDDVGFDSNLYGMELRWLWGPDADHRRTITVWSENEKRDFTTESSSDLGHFGREDDITQYRAGYEHELNRNWQLRFAYRYRNNDSFTPDPLGGTSTTSFLKHVGYTSVVYRFDHPPKAPRRPRSPRPPREQEQR